MFLQEFKTSSGHTYANVYYEEQQNTIIDVWEGVFGTQDNFKAVILYMCDQVDERGATRWLADLREMKGSFDGSKDWIVGEIIPRLIRSGLLFQAIVQPRNIFAKLSTRDTILKIENFELRQFDDIEEAKRWLNETDPAVV